MNAVETMQEVEALGGRFRVYGTSLHVRWPKGAVSAEMRDAVSAHQEAIRKRTLTLHGRTLTPGEIDRLDWTRDPRAQDLREDFVAWSYLFGALYDVGDAAACLLVALRLARVCGARLVRDADQLRLTPGTEMEKTLVGELRSLHRVAGVEVLVNVLSKVPPQVLAVTLQRNGAIIAPSSGQV